MAQVNVRGLRELNRALARTSKDVRAGVRREERTVAEPIRATAEELAASQIRRIGPDWSRMRTGVTSTLIYVAPRERGVSRNADLARRRPNLAGLLMNRAMQPALDLHGHAIEQRFDDMLAGVCNRFSL